jgi:MFS family permease
MTLAGILGVALIIFGEIGGTAVLLIGSFLFGLVMSLASVGPPLTVRSVFGTREYGQIFAVVMMGFNLASVFAATIIGFIYDTAGSYIPALYMVIALIALAFLASWLAVKLGKNLKS